MPYYAGQPSPISRVQGWRYKFGGSGSGVAPAFFSGEEGDVSNNVVEITFTLAVTATIYDAGVTLKINGVAATITSATRQTDHTLVHYTILEDIDINDVVTFEYDDDFGDLAAEADGTPVADISASGTTNYVGSHHYFDEEWCSGHHAEI